MEKNLNNLNSAANRAWQRDLRVQKETVDSSAIYHAGVVHLLVPLAKKIRNEANALHSSCRSAPENMHLDLDLDIFDNSSLILPNGTASKDKFPRSVKRDRCVASIAKAHKDERIAWKILGQTPQTGNLHSVRMQVERTEYPRSDSGVPLLAYSKVIENNAKTQFFSSDLCYNIHQSEQNPTLQSSEAGKTLRDLFDQNGAAEFSDPDILGKSSKFRVAFELAQACLLLLRTSLFSGICSCHLRCSRATQESDPFLYYFGLQMGLVTHGHPTWEHVSPGVTRSCWGETDRSWNVLTKPLRHLGLLLIEALLGRPIAHAQVQRNGVIETISFFETVHGPSLSIDQHSETVEDVLEKVRKAFNYRDRARDAVKFCLSTILPEAPLDIDMEKRLGDFYFEVVTPLKDHYDSLLDRHFEYIRVAANPAE
ncbi:hypothetical protein ACLMJK_007001 [Lecanora helva]